MLISERNISDDCHGKLLRVLLFVDDLALLASSPEEDLQDLVDALQTICAANSLHVMVDMSAVGLFLAEGKQGDGWSPCRVQTAGMGSGGSATTVVAGFRCLGLTIHQSAWVLACVPALSAAAASYDMWGMLARCKPRPDAQS